MGCPACMKYSLIFVNVLVALLGLAAAGLGIYVLVDQKSIIAATDQASGIPMLLDKAAIVLIVGGGVVVIIAGIGLFGACRESRCLIGAYGAIVTIMMVLQIVAIVLVCVYRNKIEEVLKQTLVDELSTSYVMPETGKTVGVFSTTWDSVQYELECCGVNDHKDFKNAVQWHKSDNLNVTGDNYPLPSSCCRYNNPWVYPDQKQDLELTFGSCRWNGTAENTWLDNGCYKEVKRQIGKASSIIIASAAVVGFIEILAMLFAWALFCECCGSKEMLV